MVTPNLRSVPSQTERRPTMQGEAGETSGNAMPARIEKSAEVGLSLSLGNPRPSAEEQPFSCAEPFPNYGTLKSGEATSSDAQMKYPKGEAKEVSEGIRLFIDAFDKFRKQHKFNTLDDLLQGCADSLTHFASRQGDLLHALFGVAPNPQVYKPTVSWGDLISILGSCYNKPPFPSKPVLAQACQQTSKFFERCYPVLSEWLSTITDTDGLDKVFEELSRHIVLFAQQEKRIPSIYAVLIFLLFDNVDGVLRDPHEVVNRGIPQTEAISVFKNYRRYYMTSWENDRKEHIVIDGLIANTPIDFLVYSTLDWLFAIAEITADDYLRPDLIKSTIPKFVYASAADQTSDPHSQVGNSALNKQTPTDPDPSLLKAMQKLNEDAHAQHTVPAVGSQNAPPQAGASGSNCDDAQSPDTPHANDSVGNTLPNKEKGAAGQAGTSSSTPSPGGPTTSGGVPAGANPDSISDNLKDSAWHHAKYQNDAMVVWTWLERINEVYVPPRLCKSDCADKICFTVYLKEKKKYIEHSMSLNYELFLNVAQHINRLSKEAVLSKICEPDGVHYKFETKDLPYASSEMMYDVLTCVCSVASEPKYFCDDVIYEDTHFVPKGVAPVKVHFREDYRPRAYNLMPGVRVWPVQPWNENNFTKAVNKRFLNRYQALSEDQLALTKASIQIELDTCKTPKPHRIYYSGCFEHYVEQLHAKKHLTIGQSKEFLAYAAVCEQYFTESTDQCLFAFISTLKYDTKSFIKNEVDTIDTTMRFITSPSNFIKVLLGPLFEAVDECLFFSENAMFKDCHIKGKDPMTIRQELTELNNYAAMHMLKFLQTDISAFEASQCQQAQQLEFMYYCHFCSEDPFATKLLSAFGAFLASQSTCYSKYYDVTHGPMRLSGLNNTSTGNWLLNHINCEHVIARRAHIVIHKKKYEGDDGLLAVAPFVSVDEIAQYSLFPMTFIESTNLFDLSFCGWHLDANGNRRVDDPEKFYSKIATYFSTQQPSLRQAYEYVTLRLFSAQCMYPFDPCVEHMVALRDRYFRGVNFQIRKKTYDRFVRENWFKFGNFQIPYLEEYNDPDGKMIRVSDFLDSFNPDDFSVLDNLKQVISKKKEQFIRAYATPSESYFFGRFMKHNFCNKLYILLFWLWWCCTYFVERKILFNLGLMTYERVVPSPCSYKLFNIIFTKLDSFSKIKNYYRIRSKFGVDIAFKDQLSQVYHRITKRVDTFLSTRLWRKQYAAPLSQPLSEHDIGYNMGRVFLKPLMDRVVANVNRINTLYQLYALNLSLVEKNYIRDVLPAAFEAIRSSDTTFDAQQQLDSYINSLMDKNLSEGLTSASDLRMVLEYDIMTKKNQ